MFCALVLGLACFDCGSSDTGTTGGNNPPGSSGSNGSSGSSGGSETEDDGGSSGSDGPSDTPTLAAIQSTIFASSCSGNMCHGSGARGGLKLTDKATSCANLVGVDVEDSASVPGCSTGGASAAGMKRVTAGDPSASFLYLKLTATSNCVSVDGTTAGERMPKGDDPLSAAQIRMIEQWIKAGASCD